MAGSPLDIRLAELQNHVQRETDVLALARDVVKQLEGLSSQDQLALAEVKCNFQISLAVCNIGKTSAFTYLFPHDVS